MVKKVIQLFVFLLFPSMLTSEEVPSIKSGFAENDIFFLEASLVDYNAHQALASMLGMRPERLRANFPAIATGNAFDDRRLETERLERIASIQASFEHLRNEHGRLGLIFSGIQLYISQPVLDSEITIGRDIFEAHLQEFCGLITRMRVTSPYKRGVSIYVDYPPMSQVRGMYGPTKLVWASAAADINSSRRCNRNNEDRGLSNTASVEYGGYFRYRFNDIDVGQELFNRFSSSPVQATVKCEINGITREPAVDVVCSGYYFEISTNQGELVYRSVLTNGNVTGIWGWTDPFPLQDGRPVGIDPEEIEVRTFENPLLGNNSPVKNAEPYGDDTNTLRTTGDNLLRAMMGKTWAGAMTQGNQRYRVEVNAQASRILVNYPSLRCSGVWEIIEATDSEIVFREVIQVGRDVCVSVGYVTATEQANGEVSVGWARRRSEAPSAHAVLSQD